MTALTMTLTDAGRARIAAAQMGEAVDLTVARLALSDAMTVAAPTLEALPGTFARLPVSGEIAAPGIIHLTALDGGEAAYGVRAIGLELDDGLLFAVFAGPTRIVEKSAATTLALALDVAFAQPGVDRLVFGDAHFLIPPATAARPGLIEIATPAEIAAEAAGLAIAPDALAAFARSAGAAGCVRLPGGFLLQSGRHRLEATGEAKVDIVFPLPFAVAAFPPIATPFIAAPRAGADLWLQICGEPTLTGFSVQYQAGGASEPSLDGFNWWALGR